MKADKLVGHKNTVIDTIYSLLMQIKTSDIN